MRESNDCDVANETEEDGAIFTKTMHKSAKCRKILPVEGKRVAIPGICCGVPPPVG
jgi:hypothetical protein